MACLPRSSCDCPDVQYQTVCNICVGNSICDCPDKDLWRQAETLDHQTRMDSNLMSTPQPLFKSMATKTFCFAKYIIGKTWRSPSLESLDEKFDDRKLPCEKGYESVSYKLVNLPAHDELERFGEEQASRNGGMCRLSLLPSLHFEGLTPEECHFRMAESKFFRMSQNRRMEVTKVEFIKNVDLEERFNRKKEEFKTSNVAVEARFVFHGTDSAAIDRIAKEGFKIGGTEGVDKKNGASHGPGVYTQHPVLTHQSHTVEAQI